MKTLPKHHALLTPANRLFRTALGRVTPYAFTCGHVERFDTKPGELAGQIVEIWRDGGCDFYNIRAHDHNTGKRLFWESRKNLREARALFDRTRRAMEKGEPVTV